MHTAGGNGTFLAAAQQGMFAIDTVAAEEITASIKQIRESLDERLRLLDYLKTQAIAMLDTLVAAGDQQSLHFALQRFAVVLDDLIPSSRDLHAGLRAERRAGRASLPADQ